MPTMERTTYLENGFSVDGRYTVVDRISSGAQGAVYRATDDSSGSHVAIKQLVDLEATSRFGAEAGLLGLLDHPRIVAVHDHIVGDEGQFLVMELVEGPDLSQVLAERGDPGLPIDEVLEYGRQVCEALHYVHEQQILHRDIKPQNLILSDRGIVLVDFGIARVMSDEDATVGIGTPRFMAPEVFAGGAISVRTDVFGLAATLWALLAGRPPVYAEPTPLSDIAAGIPRDVEVALRAGLALVPDRRISSVTAFAKALGVPIRQVEGKPLVQSVGRRATERDLLESIVATAARVFDAASCSIALTDETTGELVYLAAWGVGGRQIVGVRLAPGEGIAGSVVQSGEPAAVADTRSDERFLLRVAAGVGFICHTMLVVPLKRGDRTVGALSLLDRRDGRPYGIEDVERAMPFSELLVLALDVLGTTAAGHR